MQEQGSANLLYKRKESKHVRLCGPYSLLENETQKQQWTIHFKNEHGCVLIQLSLQK